MFQLECFQFLAIDDFGTAEDRDDNEDSDDEDVVHPIRIIPSNLQDMRDEFQPFPHVKCKFSNICPQFNQSHVSFFFLSKLRSITILTSIPRFTFLQS